MADSNWLDLQNVWFEQGDMALDGSLQKILTVTEETLDADRTITWNEIKGGLILFDLTESQTATLPTAALIRAGLLQRQVGSSITVFVRNVSATLGENLTIAGGVGVTMLPTSVVAGPGEVKRLLLRLTNSAVGSEAVTVEVVGETATGAGGVDDNLVEATSVLDTPQTWTANNIVGGMLIRSFTTPGTGLTADVMPTSELIIAAMPSQNVRDCVYFNVRNTNTLPQDTITIGGGAGNVYSPTSLDAIPAGYTGKFAAVISTAGSVVTIYSLGIVPTEVMLEGMLVPTALATAGVGTYTAELCAQGWILRDPAGAARADDFDTAVAILAALGTPAVNSSKLVFIENTADADEVLTITATDAAVTLVPTTVELSASQIAICKLIVTSTTTITIRVIAVVDKKPYEKRVTATDLATAGAETITAAMIIAGLLKRDVAGNGATTDTFSTGALLYAALGSPAINTAFDFEYRNESMLAEDDVTFAVAAGLTFNQAAPLVKAGQTCRMIGTVTAADTIVMEILSITEILPVKGRTTITTLDTAGADTITAEMLVSGYTKRNPAGGDRDDTLPTVTALVAAMQAGGVPATSMRWIYENIADANEVLTLVTAAGWTLDPATAGAILVSPGEALEFEITIDTPTTATLALINRGVLYPVERLNEFAATLTGDATPTAAQLIGKLIQFDPDTTDRLVTLPTAALTIAAMGLGAAGEDWFAGASVEFYVKNTGNNGSPGSEAILTMTTNTDWTITDLEDVEIQPGQIKKYLIKVTSATTCSLFEVDSNIVPQCGFVRYDNPIAAELISVIDAVLPTNGGPTDLGAIAAQPDYPRTLQVRLVNGGGIDGGTLTIVGTDVNGKTISQAFDISGATGTQITNDAYAQVTSVTTTGVTNAAGGDTIGVGVGAALGVPCRRGGVLLRVYKWNEDDADVAAGTIDSEFCHITSGNAPNAALDYSVWYEYI